MKTANPYLNFNGNTEEAFNYYRTIFGGEFPAILRFRDFGDSMGDLTELELNKIAHIALPLGENNILMGTDALESMGPALQFGNNVHIALEPESSDEADTLFSSLCDGGSVEMSLQETDWAEKYGSCTDRFGVHWMVNYPGAKLQ